MTLYIHGNVDGAFYLSTADNGDCVLAHESTYFRKGSPETHVVSPTFFATKDEAKSAGEAAGFEVREEWTPE